MTVKASRTDKPIDTSDQLRLLQLCAHSAPPDRRGRRGAAVNGTVIKRKPGETAHCIRVHCLHRGQCRAPVCL